MLDRAADGRDYPEPYFTPPTARETKQKNNMSTPKQGDFITVVYKITDLAEWSKTNPLHYAHNGLEACAGSLGNTINRHDRLLAALEEIRDDVNSADDIAKAAIDNDSKR